MTSQLRRAVCADDFLGPGDKRFFSTGYKCVNYDPAPLQWSLPGQGDQLLTGSVALSFPGTWSTKAAGDLLPHLSTIDAIILGSSLAEVVIADSFAADRAWTT